MLGAVSQLLGFGYRVALSRLVGAQVMGLYQLIMPVYSVLLSLTAVGLTVAVSTLSAKHYALGDTGAVRLTLRRALGCFLLAAVPLGAVVILFSDPISVYLIGDARTRLGIVLLVPCVLLTGVENLHKHCFYGIGRVQPPAGLYAAAVGRALGGMIRKTDYMGQDETGGYAVILTNTPPEQAEELAVRFARAGFHWEVVPS